MSQLAAPVLIAFVYKKIIINTVFTMMNLRDSLREHNEHRVELSRCLKCGTFAFCFDVDCVLHIVDSDSFDNLMKLIPSEVQVKRRKALIANSPIQMNAEIENRPCKQDHRKSPYGRAITLATTSPPPPSACQHSSQMPGSAVGTFAMQQALMTSCAWSQHPVHQHACLKQITQKKRSPVASQLRSPWGTISGTGSGMGLVSVMLRLIPNEACVPTSIASIKMNGRALLFNNLMA